MFLLKARHMMRPMTRSFSLSVPQLQAGLSSGNLSAAVAQVSPADIKAAPDTAWMGNYINLLNQAQA